MKIERGTIKVVWIAKNRKRIHSKMFENIKQADKFGKIKGDYIIFKLIKEKDMNEFEWEILPYGKCKTYNLILNLYSKEKLLGL